MTTFIDSFGRVCSNLSRLTKYWTFSLLIFFLFAVPAFGNYQIPSFKLKAGFSNLTIKAGDRIAGENLRSVVTLQPSMLWDLTMFRSRVGVHFLTDLFSQFGQMPISGIGVSGAFYIRQISSAYEYTQDGVLQQRTKSGFFISGSLTPVNTNLNREASLNVDKNDLSAAALVIDFMGGIGFDYPMGSNFILSSELNLRVGANQSSEARSQNLSYSGYTFFISFLSTYY